MLDTKNVTFYTRYVDDILIIYDTKRIKPDTTHNYINQIHTNLQLNPTYENNGRISLLELTITYNTCNVEIDIFQKLTIDTTINFLSSYPTEHKTAAYRYHITRMHILPLPKERQQTEWKVTQLIAQNNNFPKNSQRI